MINYYMSEMDELTIVNTVQNSCEEISNENAEDLLAATRNLSSKREPEAILERVGNKIVSKGVVGVIQAENCSMEILPKIDLKYSGESERSILLRNRLVRMISVAFDLNIDLESQSFLGSQDNTLLEILICHFAKNLADAVRHGMPQKYVQFEEDLPALRGSLNVVRQFSVHAVNPTRLACRFDEFSQDILLNQVMKSTVELLARISTKLENQILLKELSMIYADISYVPADRINWNLIIINRTNERWEQLLTFAKLFLNYEFQNTTGGTIDGVSLLFSMNVLFEKYIRRLIQMAMADSNYSVKFNEGRDLTMLDDTNKVVEFEVKPDIIIESAHSVNQIIDTKWKYVLDKKNSWDVKNEDVYQVVAYSKIFDTNQVSLIYPHISDLEREGIQLTGYVDSDKSLSLNIFTFDLTADVVNGLNEIERIEVLLSNLEA